jgi:hypothetical protein
MSFAICSSRGVDYFVIVDPPIGGQGQEPETRCPTTLPHGVKPNHPEIPDS